MLLFKDILFRLSVILLTNVAYSKLNINYLLEVSSGTI